MPWLTNWNYRKAVTITNTESALTDYQVSIVTDTLTPYNAGKMRLDCGDIRFADTDGSTLLNYWIESGINTISTKIWIKVPSIPSGTKTIYLYYGSPTATYNNAQGLTNTFIREISGVVGAWSFDGNALDASGNANNGTLYGGMGYTAGKFGQAASFDGVNDYVEVVDSSSFIFEDKLTFGAWIYANSLSGTQGILWKDTAFGSQRLWELRIDGTTLSAYIWNTSDDEVQSPTVTISVNTWYHVFIVYDGSTISLYLNGISQGTPTSQSGNIQVYANSVYIGAGHNGISNTYYFNGSIDEVRIYNSALSADEISDLYNNYGYVTTNYPNKELVRKYISPEPTFSISTIEETPANITATNIVVSPSIPCVEGTCIVTVDVIWTNTGTGSGDFVPNIKIDDTVQTPVYPLQSLTPAESVTKSFTITGLSIGTHTICPDPN